MASKAHRAKVPQEWTTWNPTIGNKPKKEELTTSMELAWRLKHTEPKSLRNGPHGTPPSATNPRRRN